jgi:hypothetical protein
MHDSHPAEKLSTGAHHQRGSYAPGTGLHRPWSQDRRCGTDEQCRSLLRRHGTHRRHRAVLVVLDPHAGKDDQSPCPRTFTLPAIPYALYVDLEALRDWLGGKAALSTRPTSVRSSAARMRLLPRGSGHRCYLSCYSRRDRSLERHQHGSYVVTFPLSRYGDDRIRPPALPDDDYRVIVYPGWARRPTCNLSGIHERDATGTHRPIVLAFLEPAAVCRLCDGLSQHTTRARYPKG